MSFTFNALIDGQVVVKTAVSKKTVDGGRAEVVLVDADGVEYVRSADDGFVFVPADVETGERYTETPVSHEPQEVALNEGGPAVVPGPGGTVTQPDYTASDDPALD